VCGSYDTYLHVKEDGTQNCGKRKKEEKKGRRIKSTSQVPTFLEDYKFL
jgi:hypothetical protein